MTKKTPAPATRTLLGPFEVEPDTVATVCDDQPARTVCVEILDGGPEAFTVRTTSASGTAYRTEQRMELATRLQLPADYDPLDLVGRVFLLES